MQILEKSTRMKGNVVEYEDVETKRIERIVIKLETDYDLRPNDIMENIDYFSQKDITHRQAALYTTRDNYLRNNYGETWEYLYISVTSEPDGEFHEGIGGVDYHHVGAMYHKASLAHIKRWERDLLKMVRSQIKEKLGLSDYQVRKIPVEREELY